MNEIIDGLNALEEVNTFQRCLSKALNIIK